MPPLPLNGRDLTIDNVIEVARGRRPVAIDDAAAARMRASRSVIERLVAEGATVYGVTTGFGDLADEDERQVGERRQVARGTQAAARRDDGMHGRVEHVDQQLG